MSNRFIKPPLTEIEKEKKAEDFLNFSTISDSEQKIEVAKITTSRVLKKEKVKPILLRFPLSMAEDIMEISALTGISMNAVCIELMRSVLKEKLKELKS